MVEEDNKQFTLPETEEHILEFWDKHNIFEKSLEQTRNHKPFVFYDGPPFATGLPHYGHLLASTIKDAFARYQTMKGHFVRRRWGWDCHGLPIEEVVERKLGISGKKQIEQIGLKKFNETCRSMVLEYAGEWKETIRRIGRWVEFDDSYKTMDVTYMESVWWAFKEIYKKGLTYEGRKVLLYCPRCETPVSNFEVAMDNSYKDVTDESVYVKFKVKNPGRIGLSKDNVYLIAWTTTPWTLPGNIALAVGPEIKYRAVQSGNEYLIAAVDRLSDLDLITGRVEQEFAALDLSGLEYEPLFSVPAMRSDKSYKVYIADFVTTEDGTGIVHTAVVYGEDDYNLGLKEGLPIVPLLDDKGLFNDKAPQLIRGQYFKKADPIVIADLEERNLLFKKEKYTHSYPHCWRCGTALYYNAIPAWFINIQKIKAGLIKSNDREINWFPEHLKHGRYEKSVEAAPDWNISRNRYWGNPMPVWKCDKCGREEVVGGIDELATKLGKPKNNYWVMRHGEAETNVFDITDSGQGSFHLTPLGKIETKRSIDNFKRSLTKEHKKIDLIIASDIMRTAETAMIDEKELGKEKIGYDKRLREINLGPTLSGCHDDKYHKLYPSYMDKFEKRPAGGESLRDLRKRLWDFLVDCEAKHEGKNILLVTHEYPIWMIFTAAQAWDERRSIQEKEKHGKDYVNFAEIRKLDLKLVPHNDIGEADLHRPYIDEATFVCESCGGTIRRIPEIFDSWVEAGSMPFAEFHYPFENKEIFEKRFPAQFVAEYIAQTRAWFYVMHVISFILFGRAPFDNVVTTGTILAEDGSKMSKSKGNYPDPKLLLGKYGADSLRFYMMNSVVMQADNLNFSEKGVESVYRKVELILSNVYKYYATYVNLRGSNQPSGRDREAAALLDSWIKMRTEELIIDVTKYMDDYDTVHATRAVQEYVDDLSTWYLRRSRKRDDEGFFETMYEGLLAVSKVIAPFTPFLADDLYRKLKSHRAGSEKAESVHLAEWPKAKFSLGESKRKELAATMAEVRQLASIGLSKREEVKVRVRQPLAKLEIDREKPLSGGFAAILADEVNVKEIVFVKLPEGERVRLETALDHGLREEGIMREMTRLVQGLRREAGLSPADAIDLYIECQAEIRSAIESQLQNFKSEVGAKVITLQRSDKFTAEKEVKLDGSPIWIGLAKV